MHITVILNERAFKFFKIKRLILKKVSNLKFNRTLLENKSITNSTFGGKKRESMFYLFEFFYYFVTNRASESILALQTPVVLC